MKLRILGEGDSASSASCSADTAASSAGFDCCPATNTSVGSGVVNYGPSNPYLSNLEEYKRRKKNREKDDVYERENIRYSKNSNMHKNSNKHGGKGRYHEPEGW